MAKRSKRRRAAPDKRGHGGGQYMSISYALAHSDVFRGLSGPALKLWIELRCRYNGGNNGRLHVSMGEAATLLGMSKSTAQRAYRELVGAGLLVLMKEGHWYGRRAHEWRCTDIPHDGHPATRDWQRIPKIQKAVPVRDISG